jgi:hypothetical protein
MTSCSVQEGGLDAQELLIELSKVRVQAQASFMPEIRLFLPFCQRDGLTNGMAAFCEIACGIHTISSRSIE